MGYVILAIFLCAIQSDLKAKLRESELTFEKNWRRHQNLQIVKGLFAVACFMAFIVFAGFYIQR
jgi:fatty acid desaturase